MALGYQEANLILNNSSILYKADEIESRIIKLASNVEKDLGETVPVFLTVMNGGLFFAAELLKRIKKPFLCDYIHASRYGDATFGSTHITWYRQPKVENIVGRDVYVIDDILDEGHTLNEVRRFLLTAGANSCKIIVLIDKDLGKSKPIKADYVGLTAPNRYLFGYGMDIHEVYRQLPEIYIYNN